MCQAQLAPCGNPTWKRLRAASSQARFEVRERPFGTGRMNGTCAGGTGAFIDQMATLLHTDASGLNELASRHQQ